MMFANPATKYVPFRPFTRDFSERTWPGKRITHPPIWMSTDLRDGNQALIEPMSVERKLRFFDQLVKIGFKEIEVGFPSASQTDFDFVRKLIDEKRIPDDVTIIVLTQAREELISRTVESAAGAKRAMIHLYNACAPSFRKIVFNMNKDEVKNVAVTGTKLVMKYMAQHPGTDWRYEYSPEVFSTTEPEFALEVANAVAETWGATPGRKLVLNLPATIEATQPNLYADQIEWMCKNLARRDSIIVSLHPHNDRGTAVAAAEFGVMAGADRIEGCLFGSGERTGNVDLVTLALNLYTQGIHPGLDFSDIDEVRRTAEYCNQIPVHPRHPYAGDLVFTAFSGSHQDAIKKGLDALGVQAAAAGTSVEDVVWAVPYLPIDPKDVGRSYEAIIRVNSQSGKGGISYLLKSERDLDLPRRLQIEFSRVVQGFTDEHGSEVTADDLWRIFNDEYLPAEPGGPLSPWGRLSLRGTRSASIEDGPDTISVDLVDNGEPRTIEGTGNGPIAAFINALDGIGVHVQVLDYAEHALSSGGDATAAAYVECAVGDQTLWGVGLDPSITTASLKAIVSAVNRALR